MKTFKNIILIALICLSLSPTLSLADEISYENIIIQVNQVKDYINQEMYLEAIELCNNTQYGGLNISPSDFTLLSNLKSKAQDGYDLYTMRLNSEMVDIERHNINYMILDGNYLEAIAKCDDILNNYKLLGDDIECIQMFKETAQECYDMYLAGFTYENVYDEIMQIINYINDGLYLEAIDDCQKTLAWHNLSPKDEENIKWLLEFAKIEYSNYLSCLNSLKPKQSVRELTDKLVEQGKQMSKINNSWSKTMERNFKIFKGEMAGELSFNIY